MAPTDQQLCDKARELDENCRLLLSNKHQDWLEEILYDDEGNARKPQLTPASSSFLQQIWTGKYNAQSI